MHKSKIFTFKQLNHNHQLWRWKRETFPNAIASQPAVLNTSDIHIVCAKSYKQEVGS